MKQLTPEFRTQILAATNNVNSAIDNLNTLLAKYNYEFDHFDQEEIFDTIDSYIEWTSFSDKQKLDAITEHNAIIASHIQTHKAAHLWQDHENHIKLQQAAELAFTQSLKDQE